MRYGLCLLGLLLAAGVQAGGESMAGATGPRPHIAIIIDDIGNQLHDGRQVIDLPGDITVSIIPYTPYARRLARIAHRQGREVMLHLPMESMHEQYLGRAGLDENMTEARFKQTLGEALTAIPDIRGVNNHMGSRLTQDARRMSWLMAGLLRHGDLYFVDSRTSGRSLAGNVAREFGLEHASRDVFLDDSRSLAKLQRQWQALLRLARVHGSAVAIGHPYPETIQFLQQVLPGLERAGISLVPVSGLIQWRQTRRRLAWQTPSSLSPSPRAAKNSKPSP